MSLAAMFAATRERHEIALVPYVTAGYPSTGASLDFIDQAALAGADAIEIGLPFSDPVAAGPTIQFASHQALESGFKTRAFLEAPSARPRPCPRTARSGPGVPPPSRTPRPAAPPPATPMA